MNNVNIKINHKARGFVSIDVESYIWHYVRDNLFNPALDIGQILINVITEDNFEV